MKAELKIECDKCIEDVTIDITLKGRKTPSFSEITYAVEKQGYKIGRNCYCPSCYSKLPSHCATCEYFEGRKSMGSSLCRLDGKFTTENDYCEMHKPICENEDCMGFGRYKTLRLSSRSKRYGKQK